MGDRAFEGLSKHVKLVSHLPTYADLVLPEHGWRLASSRDNMVI